MKLQDTTLLNRNDVTSIFALLSRSRELRRDRSNSLKRGPLSRSGGGLPFRGRGYGRNELISGVSSTLPHLKNFFLLLLACSVALTFSSCKNFLSQTSVNDGADEDMFQDAASLESARIGLY